MPQYSTKPSLFVGFMSLMMIALVIGINVAFLYLLWKLGWATIAFLGTH